ncbi:MAG: hypothetical protein LBP75_01300, partial [Planctomycetota bacterium]|nr:hypothetical protein [Planctomycetota bacterium]
MIIIPTVALKARRILAQGKRRRSISRATLGKRSRSDQPQLDGSPRFGEPLPPPPRLPPQTARRDCRIDYQKITATQGYGTVERVP